MSEIYVTRIRTEFGDKQIDYRALAEKPEFDDTLQLSGHIADAKATGDAIRAVSENIASDVETFRDEINTSIESLSSNINALDEKIDTSVSTLESEMSAKIEELFVKNEDGETVMQSSIKMNDNKITGLGTPEEETDAATKQYVDTSTSNMTEYIDSKRLYTTIVVKSDDWVGDAAPYTQEIVTTEVQGILASDTPHWGLIYSDDVTVKLLERSNFALVDDLETFDDKVVFTCFENKPVIDLLIQIEVNR